MQPARAGAVRSVVVWSYAMIGATGAVQAVRRDLPARFGGLRWPGTPIIQALSTGTALSAPPALLVAAIIDDCRSRRWSRLLAMGFLVGAAGECDTYRTLRHPRRDPATTIISAANLSLPAAMLLLDRRS
ncbi:MAG: hypothetical protein ABIO83_01970 [Ilumatobacteraceae bacterium]